MGTDHHLFLRWQRVQRDRDFGDESQGSLAPREEFAQVGFRQGLVDGIAATAALEALVGVILFNQPAGLRIVAPSFQLRQDGIQQRPGRPVPGLLHTRRIEIGAIGQHALTGDDMVPCTAVHQRMRPAGIVAEHAADAASVAGGRFRREQQTVRLQRQIQFIADDSGLHPGPTLFGIDFQDLVPTLDVHDDSLPHHLAGE